MKAVAVEKSTTEKRSASERGQRNGGTYKIVAEGIDG